MTFINLNNQDLELKYDVNSICALEEKTGKGLFALIDAQNIGFSTVRNLIWAGLRSKNPALTVEIVGNWIYEDIKKGMTFDKYFENVMKALEESGLTNSKDKDDINLKESTVGENIPTQK